MSATTDLSGPLRALGIANAVRMRNVVLRNRIGQMPSAEGARFAAELLVGGECAAMRVGLLLTSIASVGRTKAEAWCARPSVRCSFDRRLDELTERQRLSLAEALCGFAEQRERRLRWASTPRAVRLLGGGQ